MPEKEPIPTSVASEHAHGRHLVEEGMRPLSLPPRYAKLRGTMDVGALYPERDASTMLPEHQGEREGPADLQWVEGMTGRTPASLSIDVSRVDFVAKGMAIPKQHSDEGAGATRSLQALLGAFRDDAIPGSGEPDGGAPIMWSHVVPKVLIAQNTVHPSRTFLMALTGRTPTKTTTEMRELPTGEVRKESHLRFRRTAGKNALMVASTLAGGSVGWLMYHNLAALPLAGVVAGLATMGLCLVVAASLAVMRYITHTVEVPATNVTEVAHSMRQSVFIKPYEGKPTHCTMDLSEDRHSLVIQTEDTYQTQTLRESSVKTKDGRDLGDDDGGLKALSGRVKVKDRITITYHPGADGEQGRFSVVFACHALADPEIHAVYEEAMADLKAVKVGDTTELDALSDEVSALISKDFFKVDDGVSDVPEADAAGSTVTSRTGSDPEAVEERSLSEGEAAGSDDGESEGGAPSSVRALP